MSNKLQDYWIKQSSWQLSKTLPQRALEQIKFLKKEFIPKLLPTDIVCDLACACGDFAFVIAPHVNHVDGYDFSEKMLETAKGTAKNLGVANVSFEYANALTFQPRKNYDAYMILGLFTYFSNDKDVLKTLKEIHASLKSGGYIVIKDSLTTRKENLFFEDNDYAAIYRNINNYLKMYEQVGFELIKTSFLAMPNAEKLCSSISVFRKK